MNHLLHSVHANVFFYNHPAPTDLYTLSLHDALPISSTTTVSPRPIFRSVARPCGLAEFGPAATMISNASASPPSRSEERRVGKECRSRCAPNHQKKKRTDTYHKDNRDLSDLETVRAG